MSISGESDRPHKRRRAVRKGTHSCWACKRRKEKCERTTQDLTTYVCHGCRRRGTRCVGQEYPEDDTVDDGQRSLSGPFELGRTVLDDTFAVLSSALPNAADLKLLRKASAQTRICCIEAVGHSSSSTNLDIDFSAIEDMLKNKVACEAEPHSITRALLQIAVSLQNMSRSSSQGLPCFSEPMDRMMDRCAKAARFMISSREETFNDSEGLQCAILESMYRIGSGHLRLGWISCRKAILLAQSMGLPVEESKSAARLYLPGLPATVDELNGLWSYLTRQDLLISRLLGLQPGVYESPFLAREQVERLETLENLHSNIMARLAKYELLRPHPPDFEKVVAIDKELRTAGAAMAKDWWLIPDLTDKCTEGPAGSCNLRRLVVQMVHFDLRTRLYVPHMFYRASAVATQQQTDTAREICIHASREVLSRTVLLRSHRPIDSGLQIPDFLGVMAAIALLLGYLCRSSAVPQSTGQRVGLTANDRILVMQALANTQRLHTGSPEASVKRCIDVMKYLLEIQITGEQHDLETDTADRGIEHQIARGKVAAPRPEAIQASQPGSKSDCNPYFGAIDILLSKNSVQDLDEQKRLPRTTYPTGLQEQGSQEDGLESLPTETRVCLTYMQSIDLAFVRNLAESCMS